MEWGEQRAGVAAKIAPLATRPLASPDGEHTKLFGGWWHRESTLPTGPGPSRVARGSLRVARVDGFNADSQTITPIPARAGRELAEGRRARPREAAAWPFGLGS